MTTTVGAVLCNETTAGGPCRRPVHKRGYHDPNPPTLRVPRDGQGRVRVSISQLRRYGAVDLATGGEDHTETVRGCPRAYALTYGSEPVAEFPFRPAELGIVLHRAIAHMEEHAVGPATALQQVWPPTLGPLDYAEAVRILEGYLSRGGPMTMYATLASELDITEQLFVDETHGPVMFRGIVDHLAVDAEDPDTVHVTDFKGLSLDTPLPTPTGWTTMGAVSIGDQLFGSDGMPCTVTAKSSVHWTDCYRITFGDSSSIVCDGEHRWVVLAGTEGGRRKPLTPVEMTAAEIYSRGLIDGNGQRDIRIVNTDALDLPDADLPVDPYVLGAWLGDGATGTGRICKPLPELWEQIRKRGYRVSEPTNGREDSQETRTVYGLITQLRQIGLADAPKHLPVLYSRASRRQRLEVLRGLMDTDGHWHKKRHHVTMSTTAEWQADAVYELVVSLGWKANKHAYAATGFGKTTQAWMVCFTPVGDTVFLARPPQDYRPGNGVRQSRRVIRSIELVPTVPTQCVAVDSPDQTYLAGRQMVPTHNSAARPVAKESLRGDVQLMGYTWLVRQWWKTQHGRYPRRIIAHFDALRYGDIAIEYTRGELDIWAEWAAAMIRTMLRDDDPQPILNDGCSWCPVRWSCPAWLALPGDAQSAAARLAGASAEELGGRFTEAARVLRLLTSQVDHHKDVLEAETRQRGRLQVGDQEWSVETGRQTVANTLGIAFMLLPDHPGAFEVAVTATKASVERAANGLDLGLAAQLMGCVNTVKRGERIAKRKVKKGG